MSLTKPKIAPTTEKSPRVWVPKAGVTIWKNAVVGRYPAGPNAGYIDNIGADPDLIIVGVARNNCGTVPAGSTAAFAASVIVDEMIIPMDFSTNSDSSTAQRDQLVYAVAYDTSGLDKASMSATGFAPIGAFWEADSATSGRVYVGPTAIARAESSAGGSGVVGAPPGVARVVLTNLGGAVTYANGIMTGPTNTALPTQDNGVACAVGNLVFAPKGLANLPAAAQSGPWEITSLGSGSSQWTMERPSWWLTSSAIPLESSIRIGPEGLVWKSVRFVTQATAAGIVDTTDPLFSAFDFGPNAYTATVVITSLAAATTYAAGVLTGPVNTALGAQDTGVTNVVGDRVWIQKGTTNLPNAQQAGPWMVAAVGSGASQYVLVRPPEFQTGQTLAQVGASQIWTIAELGTIYGGTDWKAFAAPTSVVDTTDMLFWPRRVSVQTTMTGAGGLSPAITSIPIKNFASGGAGANQCSEMRVTIVTVGTDTTGTSWRPSAVTPGPLGTATFKVLVESVLGTAVAADTSVVNVSWTNW